MEINILQFLARERKVGEAGVRASQTKRKPEESFSGSKLSIGPKCVAHCGAAALTSYCWPA